MKPAAGAAPVQDAAGAVDSAAGTALRTRPNYAHTPRGAVHYVDAGCGEPLILLHATPGTHRAFRQLLPLLAPYFRCIAFDTPGYGNSDPVPGTASIEGMAQSVLALLDALELPHAHLLGLHTGNKIAAALAAAAPERVGRVVLAGQTHSLIVDAPARDAAIRHLIDHYYPGFEVAPGDGLAQLRLWLMAQADVASLWWPARLTRGAVVTPQDVEIAEAMVVDHLLGRRSIVPTYDAIFAYDLEAALRRMSAPTLLLELHAADEQDYEPQAPKIAAFMKAAQAVVLDDLDAGAFRRQPQRIADAVLPFLKGDAR